MLLRDALRNVTAEAIFTDTYFGGVCDGRGTVAGGGVFTGTDNAAALLRWKAYAQEAHRAGRVAKLFIPNIGTGQYNFDHSLCQGFNSGFDRAIIESDGAAFQNTWAGDGDADAGSGQAWGPNTNSITNFFVPGAGKKIATTAVGDTTVSFITAGDHATFQVGDAVAICSASIMPYGGPPNLQHIEFTRITAKHATTHALTFDPPIQNKHKSTSPDYGEHGAARIWRLFYGDENWWNVHRRYVGLEMRNIVNPGLATYITIAGRYAEFERCILPGISQTIAGTVVLKSTVQTDIGEPDKLIDHLVYQDFTGGLSFQSSSINRVSIRGGKLYFLGGIPKMLHAVGTDIDQYQESSYYGAGSIATLENCIVRRMDNPIRPATGYQALLGDGVTFANGAFSVPVALEGIQSIYWGSVAEGQWVYLDADTFFPGDIGAGYITDISISGSNRIIKTTIPQATLPAWASGKVMLQNAGYPQFINCTGSDYVRVASEANARGFAPWELWREFIGHSASSGTFPGCTGDWVRSSINVIQAAPAGVTNPRFTITGGTFDKTTLTGGQNTVVTIDTSVKGKREFTRTALTGKTTNDTVTLNAVAQTEMPAGRWLTGNGMNWAHSYNPQSYSPHEVSLIEIELQFDCGMFRKRITRGSQAGVTGQIP